MRKIWNCAVSEYLGWVTNSRMILIAVLWIFNYVLAVSPLMDRAKEMKAPVNLLEPFVAVGSSGMILLILPIVFLVLISDFPRSHGNVLFQLLRTGRTTWLLSQLLFLLMTILTYLLLVAAGTILPVIGRCAVQTEWSSVVTQYAELFPESVGSYELLPENLFYQLRNVPVAALHTYGLLALYLLLIGMFLLCSALIGKRKGGNLLTGFIIAAGTAMSSVGSAAMWFFPMAHSVTWVHFTKYKRKPVFPLSDSYILFVFAVLILLAVAFYTVRRFTFGTEEEDA